MSATWALCERVSLSGRRDRRGSGGDDVVEGVGRVHEILAVRDRRDRLRDRVLFAVADFEDDPDRRGVRDLVRRGRGADRARRVAATRPKARRRRDDRHGADRGRRRGDEFVLEDGDALASHIF